MIGIAIVPALRRAGMALLPPSPPPAVLPAPFGAVNADGWSATWADPPALDPHGDPLPFTVTRAGFDAAGQPATVNDTLVPMARLRQPWPNQASLTADQVVLSDFIHAGDTLSGAVNNSARPAPRPVCLWLQPDMLRVSGSVTVRLAVAHMYARNGRPVAAVRFILSDGTNTVEELVSTMSTITYPASGRTVPHFAATLSLAGLAANVALTLDAIVYPWVGPAFQASVHGAPQPHPGFGTMRLFNDVSYGTAYACVDAVSGNNATAVVSTNPATAAASPYLTVSAAAAGIRTFNNANFGRDNASGGVIRLVAGVHTFTTTGTTQTGTLGALPLEIEAADPALKATTVLRDNAANTTSPARVVLRNLTLRRNGTGTVWFFTNGAGANSPNFTVFDRCHFDDNGLGSFAGAWINAVGRVFFLDCTASANGLTQAAGTSNKSCILVGGTIGAGNTSHGVVGVKTLSGGFGDGGHGVGDRPAPLGVFVGFSHMALSSTAAATLRTSAAIGPAGCAIVGCVVEDLDGTLSQLADLHSDNNTQPVENIVLQMNTFVGERTNFLYQDTGTATVVKSGSVRFCVFDLFNTKTDVFAANANLVGNWPAAFHVGFRANAFLRGGSNGTAFGTGQWLGEVRALGEANGTPSAPLAAAFADPRAPGAGDGDYTPGPGSALPVIPAGLAPYPADQLGRAVPDDGTARVGALMAP